MELRVLLFLAVAGSFPLLGNAVSSTNSKTKLTVIDGSGDGDADAELDTDFGFEVEGSGTEAPPVSLRVIPAGSGGGDDDDDDVSTISPESIDNLKCVTLYCWCTYDNGTEIIGTRKYGGRPNCESVATRPTTTKKATTTTTPLPTRPTELRLHNIAAEMTETVTEQQFIFVDETTAKTTTRKPPVVLETEIPTDKPFNNDVPVVFKSLPPTVKIDEELEELSNTIGGADSQVKKEAQQTEKLATGLLITNPGILAAIIGGGVVGLLCAILLVMFIVYRMRKKDEGSYPLNDTKPLKNYAYAKAPSREFYA